MVILKREWLDEYLLYAKNSCQERMDFYLGKNYLVSCADMTKISLKSQWLNTIKHYPLTSQVSLPPSCIPYDLEHMVSRISMGKEMRVEVSHGMFFRACLQNGSPHFHLYSIIWQCHVLQRQRLWMLGNIVFLCT